MKCHKCNKIFLKKYNLNRHLNRQYACDLIHKCNHCNKVFKTKQKLDYHKERKTSCVKNNNIELNSLINEIKELRNQLMFANITNINNTTNNTNINSNNTNNIILNVFGCEDVKHINVKFIEQKLKELLKNQYKKCSGKIMKINDLKYCSNDIDFIDLNKMFIENIFLTKPENKTIKIENDKTFINEESGWKDCDISEIVESVLNNIQNLLYQLKETKFIQKTEIVKLIENNICMDYEYKHNPEHLQDYNITYEQNRKIKLQIGDLNIIDRKKKLVKLIICELLKDPEFTINHVKNIIGRLVF